MQAELGITGGAAFDVQAVCSGFVFALTVADGMLKTNGFKRALVIGAETFSRILDWSDRTTCVLFGDGAGAVVVEARPQATAAKIAAFSPLICVRMAVTRTSSMSTAARHRPSTVGHLRMEGREVFKHAVAMITDVVEDAFKATGYSAADVDWFVPHQANKRIIDGSAHKLGIAPEKMVDYGRSPCQHLGGLDSSGACRCGADGRIKAGDLVLLEAMGGGFTWGSVLLRW